jgi:hypothetical protein
MPEEGEDMKERPILFSAPMVRAILAGTKTQTRRVVTVRRGEVPGEFSPEIEYQMRCQHIDSLAAVGIRCPFSVGQRLWVRETWRLPNGAPKGWVDYRADDERTGFKWRPSIFMPRAYSRIDLEVTEVRVQRVQEISDGDAYAEGISGCDWMGDPVGEYAKLWDSINGKRAPWASTPWVWALTFRRVRP